MLPIFMGVLYPYFFAQKLLNFGKNADSAISVESYIHVIVFVWRQLEFAFFGALTSVGALFVFERGKI